MAMPLADVTWIHGAADCHSNADPLLQVHRFNADSFIMRENKCYSAEGNFMCLLLGMDKALLLDTGDLRDADSLLPRMDLPLAQAMHGILAERQLPLELIVVHTHSHHLFWDSEFPPATVVGHDHRSIMERFGLSDWPDGRAMFDLGGRPFDVFPTGREPHHIALYDRNARILLTGDMLYSGIRTVPDATWETYRQSAARLADFAAQNPVSLVLDAYIEAKKTARQFYDPQTPFQPDEHALPLGVEHALPAAKAFNGPAPIATQADAHSLPAELMGGLWLAAARCDEVGNWMIGGDMRSQAMNQMERTS